MQLVEDRGSRVRPDAAPATPQLGLEEASLDEPLDLARNRRLRTARSLDDLGDCEVPLRLEVGGANNLQLCVAAKDPRAEAGMYSHDA